jgi:putative spermidine/putrescine transport system permease protein
MTNVKRLNGWAIFWVAFATLYFFLPMYGTLDFSLRMRRGEISLQAYEIVFADLRFWEGFRYSTIMAVITILISILIVTGYVVISMPFMFRAVDVGMRAIDVRTLTEAAQSLGSNWVQILANVIIPNLRIAILSGALICFATVMGEVILASFLVRPALGPYMQLLGLTKAYEPAALAIISYALTWFSLGLIQLVSRGGARQQLTGR